jgi:hypothetical protein
MFGDFLWIEEQPRFIKTTGEFEVSFLIDDGTKFQKQPCERDRFPTMESALEFIRIARGLIDLAQERMGILPLQMVREY